MKVPTEPGAAEVPHREPGWVTLHHRVEHLAGCLDRLVGLISGKANIEIGLLWLSHYLVDWPDAEDSGSPQSEAWRAAINETDALLIEVLALWEKEPSGRDSSLRLKFEEALGDEVRCGPIQALSHHGLVINIAKCLLDRGAAKGDWPAYPNRSQVARALVNPDFYHEQLLFDLDKEYVCVRRLLRPPETSHLNHQPDPGAMALPTGHGCSPPDARAEPAAEKGAQPGKKSAALAAADCRNERRDDPTDPKDGDLSPKFSAVERAIALLMRDGGRRRSMRHYALVVGVSHSTLSRNSKWRAAWKASEPQSAELPAGVKDAEGNLEAWNEARCENCRTEPIACSIQVDGEQMNVCEACRDKLVRRTTARTTRQP